MPSRDSRAAATDASRSTVGPLVAVMDQEGEGDQHIGEVAPLDGARLGRACPQACATVVERGDGVWVAVCEVVHDVLGHFVHGWLSLNWPLSGADRRAVGPGRVGHEWYAPMAAVVLSVDVGFSIAGQDMSSLGTVRFRK